LGVTYGTSIDVEDLPTGSKGFQGLLEPFSLDQLGFISFRDPGVLPIGASPARLWDIAHILPCYIPDGHPHPKRLPCIKEIGAL